MNLLTQAQRQAIMAEIAELEQELFNLTHLVSMKEQEIYNECVTQCGRHLTLNPVVPAEEGCAEAVSKILSLVGIYDGSGGIAGTASLDAWYAASPLFERVEVPETGVAIVSPTGEGNGKIEGHTGFIGKFNTTFPNDWEIYSNDSASGDFLRTWSYSRWLAYYHVAGALPVRLYAAK